LGRDHLAPGHAPHPERLPAGPGDAGRVRGRPDVVPGAVTGPAGAAARAAARRGRSGARPVRADDRGAGAVGARPPGPPGGPCPRLAHPPPLTGPDGIGKPAAGRSRGSENARDGQCCETWKQATSYWETACGLLAVPAETPLPAYTTPAVPGPVSL